MYLFRDVVINIYYIIPSPTTKCKSWGAVATAMVRN